MIKQYRRVMRPCLMLSKENWRDNKESLKYISNLAICHQSLRMIIHDRQNCID